MQIELKNTEFKRLFEYLDDKRFDTEEMYSVVKNLRKQYHKAFLKYQNEQQEFNVGDKVEFGPKHNLREGEVFSIHKLANGHFKYKVKYKYVCDVEEDGTETFGENYKLLTKKNIKKI